MSDNSSYQLGPLYTVLWFYVNYCQFKTIKCIRYLRLSMNSKCQWNTNQMIQAPGLEFLCQKCNYKSMMEKLYQLKDQMFGFLQSGKGINLNFWCSKFFRIKTNVWKLQEKILFIRKNFVLMKALHKLVR